MNPLSRRDFLKTTVDVLCAARLAVAPLVAFARTSVAPPRVAIKKAVLISMLPEKMTYADRFKLARDTGFEAIEAQTVKDQREAEAIGKAAEEARIRVHSVMNMDHWDYPLSSPDPTVVERGIEGMKTSLHNAKLWGADGAACACRRDFTGLLQGGLGAVTEAYSSAAASGRGA